MAILQCYAHPAYHCDGINREVGIVYHEIPDEIAEEVQIQSKSEDYMDPPCLATIWLQLAMKRKGS